MQLGSWEIFPFEFVGRKYGRMEEEEHPSSMSEFYFSSFISRLNRKYTTVMAMRKPTKNPDDFRQIETEMGYIRKN